MPVREDEPSQLLVVGVLSCFSSIMFLVLIISKLTVC